MSRKRREKRSHSRKTGASFPVRFVTSTRRFLLLMLCLVLLVVNIVFLNSVINRFRGEGGSGDKTREGDYQVRRSGIPLRIEVLNGAGVGGVAQDMTDYLRQAGFDVIKYENADHFVYHETILLLRRGNADDLHALQQAIRGGSILEQRNELLGLDATLVIGHDYLHLAPFRERRGG